MHAFGGVAIYEYRMAVRRWGVWIAFLVTGLTFLGTAIIAVVSAEGIDLSVPTRQMAGRLAVSVNFAMPVIGGIAMADRLARDCKLGVRELLAATPLSRSVYVLGKYVGVVAATATPALVLLLVMAVAMIIRGAPLTLIPVTVLAFLAISLPTYAFIGAFSLACPAVMPVRVYQVLFVGYWFWGNFVNSRAIPSVSGTLLNSAGEYAANAFFMSQVGYAQTPRAYTAVEALLNIAVLAVCAAVALAALNFYLARQERLA